MSPFNKAFLELLEASDMTNADFARKTGFGTSYISQLCTGKVTDPSMSKAVIIADAFGISLQELWEQVQKHQ
ncbi:helix-turn-helix domain-containing protein [Atopobium deltae]